jgi:probable glucitol transport protein GutA
MTTLNTTRFRRWKSKDLTKMSTTQPPATAMPATAPDKAAAKAAKKLDRVSIWRVIPWSSPAFTMNALIVMTGYFTIYATDTLGLNPAMVGGLLVIAKILDAVGALFAGYIVDRAPETRFGKARPFELSIIASWAATAFLFSTPGTLGDVAKYVWIFSSYILLTAVFMPLFNANNPLYTVRVFPRREQYSDLSAKSGLVAVFAGIFITVGMPMAINLAGKDPALWSLVAICIAVPATLVGLIRFWVFKEPRGTVPSSLAPVTMRDIFAMLRGNPYIWMLSTISLLVGMYGGIGAGSYYFRYIVGNLGLAGLTALGFAVLIPLMFFFPALTRRFSVSRIIAVASFIGAFGYLIMLWAGASIPLIMASSVLWALASLPVSFLAPILVIDNATYNEWKGNRRLESVGGAVYSFAGTLGQAVSAGILGVVLLITGYVGTHNTQTPTALGGIVALNSWIPAILAVCAGLVALRYHRMEQNMKTISSEVLARRAAAAGGAAPEAPMSGTEAVRVVRKDAQERRISDLLDE